MRHLIESLQHRGALAVLLGVAMAFQLVDASAADTQTKDEPLQEVIVTAEKKEERLQDVPIPVAVIAVDSLLSYNEVKLTDYASSVPTLEVQPTIQGAQIVSIRGITTGATTGGGKPTVGVTIDDIPFSPATAYQLPDIDPSDLARVEVLRGPQGTLYGISTMGGLIKYVTVDPSTAGFSGRVEAETETIYNGAGLGDTFRAAVNIPINGDLAIRASGYTREDPGYIDNPYLNESGVNEDHAYGGHFAALWRPLDNLSVKLSALWQRTTGDAYSDVMTTENITGLNNPLGPWQQGHVKNGTFFEQQAESYGAVINYQPGAVTLTSVTGYSVNKLHDSLDITPLLGFLSQLVYGVRGTTNPESFTFTQPSQEFRVTAPITSHLDVLAGVFWTYQRQDPANQFVYATNPVTGAIAATWGEEIFPASHTEGAGFTDLTYKFSDRVDVQVGARYSSTKDVTESTEEKGPLFGPNPIIAPETVLDSHATTYLLTPRFRITSDLMVYARLASGYRPGTGTSTPAPISPCVLYHFPCSLPSDKTNNYEMGLKADFLDHKLSVDSSVYYIDWRNIPIQVTAPPPVFYYSSNGGEAKSQGVDLSVDVKPLTGLSIAAWFAYDDAVFKNLPAGGIYGVYAQVGNPLPNSAKLSGNLSLNDEFPLSGELKGFVGGAFAYLSGREGVLTTTPERQYMPAYTKLDLRAGVEYRSWVANLYATNVTNQHGLIGGGVGSLLPNSYYYIQPRTVGLSLSKTF